MLQVLGSSKTTYPKMSVVEMRTVRWMSGTTLNDRINNENIRDKLEAAPVEDKMRENHLRWFDHVESRLIDATVRRIVC